MLTNKPLFALATFFNRPSAYIEAYNGILKKEVFNHFEYRTFGKIEKIL